MRVRGFAKVNLSLQVRGRDDSGFHPLRSLVQSIAWADLLTVGWADDDDAFAIDGDLEAEASNLAWRAAVAVRRASGSSRPMSVHLQKRIPVSAGLGGGSADAAAALVAAGDLFAVDAAVLDGLAPDLGSDVLFCLLGGSAWMEGRGDRIHPARLRDGWALAVAVPPFPLSTAAVYRRWDEMDGPGGNPIASRHLPPALRDHAPLVNDLLPAARDLRPELGDWMAAVAGVWGRPVLMTGSGPAVFAFFADADEAADALPHVPESRAVWAGLPIAHGWEREA